MRTLIAFLATTAIFTCNAEASAASGPVADLGITMTVEPGARLPPGSIGSVTITITNYGPDAATDIVAVSSQFVVGKNEQILLYQTQQSQCTVFDESLDTPPGEPIPTFAILTFPGQTVLPGSSISCTIGISTYADATGTYSLDFRVLNDVVGWSDPNPSNNQTSSIYLTVSPVTVPALGILDLALLAGVIALFGTMHVTTRRGAIHASVALSGGIRTNRFHSLRGGKRHINRLHG